jgi:hypothetical protein
MLFEAAGSLSLPGSSFSSFAAGDLDGDQRVDLVVGSGASHPTMVILSAASNASMHTRAGAALSSLAHDTRALELGDVNGDGFLDVIAGIWGQPNQVYLNLNQTGAFAEHNLEPTHAPTQTAALALGDVNNDGLIDVWVANEHAANVLLLGDGYGSFRASSSLTFTAPNLWRPPVITTLITKDVALGDIDGDGDLDAVFAVWPPECCQYPGTYICRNDGSGRFEGNCVEPQDQHGIGIFNLPHGGKQGLSVRIADIDGDGSLDLLLGHRNNNQLLFNNGAGFFSSAARPGSQWEEGRSDTGHIYIMDVDLDGDLDVYAGMPFQLFLNDGSGVLRIDSGSSFDVNANAIVAAHLADLDEDGDADAIGVVSGAARVCTPTPKDGARVICSPPCAHLDRYFSTRDRQGAASFSLILPARSPLTVDTTL